MKVIWVWKAAFILWQHGMWDWSAAWAYAMRLEKSYRLHGFTPLGAIHIDLGYDRHDAS